MGGWVGGSGESWDGRPDWAIITVSP